MSIAYRCCYAGGGGGGAAGYPLQYFFVRRRGGQQATNGGVRSSDIARRCRDNGRYLAEQLQLLAAWRWVSSPGMQTAWRLV
jgi:hypothetical protein